MHEHDSRYWAYGMWPILIFAYDRLAKREEAEVSRQFPEQYAPLQDVPAGVRSSTIPTTNGESRMNRHALWMLIGCVLPVLLIFLLPAFGVSNNVTLVVFVALMFACHFFMPGHHHHGGNDNEQSDHQHH